MKVTRKIVNYDKYKQIITIKKIGNREIKTIDYVITDEKKFDATENITAIYKRLGEKYKNKIFFMKVSLPRGWKTIASNDYFNWIDGMDEYYRGKADDSTKFVSEVSKITIVIR